MPTRSFIAVVFVFALSVTPMTFEAKQAKNPGPSEHKLKKEVAAFAPLQGQWSCAGVFPSNGKKIESKIAFVADLDGAGLVKRHDDLPPNVFHDADYWGFDSAAKQFVAYIYDNFGGVRKFSSAGWADSKLIWLGEPSKSDPVRLERFVYQRDSPTQMEVNWEVKQGAKDWAIGDTLTCKK